MSSANLTGYDFTAAPTQTVAYTWSDLGDVITDPQGYGLPVAAVRLVDAGGTPVAGYIRFGNSVGSEQYAGALKYDSGWPPVGTNPAVIPSDLPGDEGRKHHYYPRVRLRRGMVGQSR